MSGVLMMIEQNHWIQAGWRHLKINVGIAAVVFSKITRAKLIQEDMNNEYTRQKFSLFRNLCLLMLLIIIIIVGYK